MGPDAPPPRATALDRHGDAAADTLSLPYAERYRRRGLLTTDSGLELMLDLAEATELGEGTALVLEDGRRIAMRAAPEPLAAVRAQGRTLARLAWHVGNRHTPAQVEEGRLLIARDPVLERMLEGLGATVEHVTEPFAPEGGAYGHGRTHGHAHVHAHEDPNAHIERRTGGAGS